MPATPLRPLAIAYWVSAGLCFLVPVALLVFVIGWVQSPTDLASNPRFPADRTDLAAPRYHIGEFFYDENDSAAYVLRGLNAHLGRNAGHKELPIQVVDHGVYSHLLQQPNLSELLTSEVRSSHSDPHFEAPMRVNAWVLFRNGPPRLDLLQRYPGYPDEYTDWLTRRYSRHPDVRDDIPTLLAQVRQWPGEVTGPIDPNTLPPRLRDLPPDGWQLRERYALEYPHLSLWIFQAGWAIQPDTDKVRLPPYLLDGNHNDLGWHRPKTENEQRLWRHFVVASRFYMSVAVAGLLGLMAVLLIGYEPGGQLRTHTAWLILPSVLFFSLNRFDILPALLTALSFLCLGRERLAGATIWAGVFMGLAVLLKVYPLLFVPIILRYLGLSKGAKFFAGWCGTMALMIGFMLLLYGPAAVRAPYQLQFARLPEIGSDWTDSNFTFYRFVLPDWLAYNSRARLAILAGTLALLCLTRPPDVASVLRRCALLLIVFVSLAVFYSPQWIIWLLPMVLPLAGRRGHVSMTVAYVLFDLLTYLTFPVYMIAFGDDDLRRVTLDWLQRWGLELYRGSYFDYQANIVLVYGRLIVMSWLSFGLLMAEGDALIVEKK